MTLPSETGRMTPAQYAEARRYATPTRRRWLDKEFRRRGNK